jgi:hypothetical protein
MKSSKPFYLYIVNFRKEKTDIVIEALLIALITKNGQRKIERKLEMSFGQRLLERHGE